MFSMNKHVHNKPVKSYHQKAYCIFKCFFKQINGGNEALLQFLMKRNGSSSHMRSPSIVFIAFSIFLQQPMCKLIYSAKRASEHLKIHKNVLEQASQHSPCQQRVVKALWCFLIFLLVLLKSEQRVFFSPLSDSRYQLKFVQVIAFRGLVYASPPGIQVDAQCLVATTTRTGKLNILERNKTLV